MAQVSSAAENVAPFRCGAKRYCREMSSCVEAMFYLKQCGLRRLDGDGDGTPQRGVVPLGAFGSIPCANASQ
ncbi:cold-shock protein [Candidatus Parcubacteria bacterium]|nr:MAG: cold-shock protein [Candidatus Parcubacteria bacterium]